MSTIHETTNAETRAKTAEMTRKREFLRGLRDTLPLLVGAIPFGLIFGAVATTSGMTGQTAAAMSAFVYAGSSQFIASGLVAASTGVAMIILTTLVVNLRHALYSVSLAPHVRGLPHKWLLVLGFLLTDETYFVAIRRYQEKDASSFKHWFYLGSGVSMYLTWQVSTWIGILAGRSIPNPQAWGLDFALPVTFIGMLIPGIASRSILLTVATGATGAIIFAGLPNGLGLFAAALLAVLVGVLASRYDKQPAVIPAGELVLQASNEVAS